MMADRKYKECSYVWLTSIRKAGASGVGYRSASSKLGRPIREVATRRLPGSSVAEMLYNMNHPDMIPRAHRPYVEFFVPIATDTNYAGADMVSTWYQRNIRIFANITRITDSADDRIFVVYGAGHVPILRQLVIDHSGYCVADPLPYLREN